MPTNIPKARRLLNMARKSEDRTVMVSLIEEALGLMKREVKTNSRRISKPITPEIVRKALYQKRARPEITHLEIAQSLGINPGRVSEIINGLRTEEHPDLPHGS